MEELCTREAYDEQPSTTDHKKTFEQMLKHHRNQSGRHWTSLLQLTLLLLHLPYQKCVKTRRRNRQRSERTAKRYKERPPDTPMTPGAPSSSRGEKRTETQEATSVKKRLTTKSSTEKRRAVFAGENRREERRRADANGGQGFVSVNTLLSDETGVETNP